MKKLFIVFGIFLFLLGCKKDISHEKNDKIESLRKRVIDKGDSYAYGILIIFYGKEKTKDFQEILDLSYIMANKHNTVWANYQVYYTIIQMHNKGNFEERLFLNLNNANKEEALKYLIKGAKLGDKGSKISLATHYCMGIGMPKNLAKADSLIYSCNFPKPILKIELKENRIKFNSK